MSEFSYVLKNVNSVIESPLAERLGLRYVDMIQLQNDERFEQYFDESLMGLSSEKVGAVESINRTELVGRTKMGKIVVRCIETVDGSFLPSDLAEANLKYDVELKDNEKVRLLDIDHYSEESRDFEVPSIIEAMWKLHDNCDMAFKNAVTPYAMQQWQAEEAPK